jgi:hypothetical protein
MLIGGFSPHTVRFFTNTDLFRENNRHGAKLKAPFIQAITPQLKSFQKGRIRT